MTNLVAQLVVVLTLGTNWTGTVKDGQELGYLTTNHVATVTYQGESKEFVLKSVPGNVAVWRSQPINEVRYLRETRYLTNTLPLFYYNGTTDLLLRSPNCPAYPLKLTPP